MDYSKKFITKGTSVIFDGDHLEIFIPMRYEALGCLDISDNVVTLGMFDMKVDGVSTGYMLPAKITIEHSELTNVVKNGDRHIKLTLTKGDVFIKNTRVVKDAQIAYLIFYEFIYGGRPPDYINYDNVSFIFDTVSIVTGISFPTDHVVFEMITSMLHRDRDSLDVLYRNTDMSKPPRIIPLSRVSHAALSTTSKIIGAYNDDGFDAAMVNAATVNSDIENLLRN